MRLARWPARSRSSGGGAVSGGRREHAGDGGSGGGESCAVHRRLQRSAFNSTHRTNPSRVPQPGPTSRITLYTDPSRGSGAFEAPHGPVAAFDAAVVLLQPVIQVGVSAVPHSVPQLGADRSGVAVVAVR